VHRDILIIKPTRCTNFSNLFWNETLLVSDSSSLHHQKFFTVHTAMVYVIQVCLQLASRIRIELFSILILPASCQQTCMTYTIAMCTVKNSWWWTEELSKTSRVSFQNKFEKLVHLVGLIVSMSTYKYNPESIPCHWGFFPGHQTVSCALGSPQPLKMSTRIFLGVRTAGAVDDLTTFMCRVSRNSGALTYQKPQRPLGL
jgi:hypothetical protein